MIKEKKLDCILEAGKNIPRALLEGVLISSVPLGAGITAVAGINYLSGNHELAHNLTKAGLATGGLGLLGVGLYFYFASIMGAAEGRTNIAIENFLDSINKYKKLSKVK